MASTALTAFRRQQIADQGSAAAEPVDLSHPGDDGHRARWRPGLDQFRQPGIAHGTLGQVDHHASVELGLLSLVPTAWVAGHRLGSGLPVQSWRARSRHSERVQRSFRVIAEATQNSFWPVRYLEAPPGSVVVGTPGDRRLGTPLMETSRMGPVAAALSVWITPEGDRGLLASLGLLVPG